MINLENALKLANEYKEENDFDENSKLLGYVELPGAYAFSCGIPNTESDVIMILVNKDNGYVNKMFILDFFKEIKGYNPEFKELENNQEDEEKEAADLFGF